MRRSPLALSPLLLAAGLMALSGCGGGGGGDPKPSGPNLSDLAAVRPTATLGSSTTQVDATNLFTGESVQFRLTGVPTTGGFTSVSVTGWRTTVPAAVGTISNSGVFTAGSANGTGEVSVRVGGVTYTGTITVKPANSARVTGKVRLTNGTGASRIGIQLLNSAGALVATGLTATDGTFRIGTTTNASRLNLNFSVIDPGADIYVRQFAFNGIDYSTVITGCTAPLPTLTAGGTVAVAPSGIVVYVLGASAPPPPPDGCSAQ